MPYTLDAIAFKRFYLDHLLTGPPKVTRCCWLNATQIFRHMTKLQSLKLLGLIPLMFSYSQSLTFDPFLTLNQKFTKRCWSNSTQIFRHTTKLQSLRLIGLILLMSLYSQSLTFDPLLTLTQRSPDAVNQTQPRYIELRPSCKVWDSLPSNFWCYCVPEVWRLTACRPWPKGHRMLLIKLDPDI